MHGRLLAVNLLCRLECFGTPNSLEPLLGSLCHEYNQKLAKYDSRAQPKFDSMRASDVARPGRSAWYSR